MGVIVGGDLGVAVVVGGFGFVLCCSGGGWIRLYVNLCCVLFVVLTVWVNMRFSFFYHIFVQSNNIYSELPSLYIVSGVF